MEERIAAYLASRMAGAEDVRVSHLYRIPGGASRETWMFKATWREGGERRAHEFILRRDPPASLLESNREVEFAYYTAFADSKVPVPGMRWIEHDASHLDGTFFIMDRIAEIESNTRRIQESAWDEARPKIARHMYEILAEIHAFEWRGSGLEAVSEAPAPETCWKRELELWEAVIDANELSPQPIARAGIRWLRRNPPPPPARVTVVHGDYRVGNILYHREGRIRAVVDWEMAHLGDPIEDLAWGFVKDWEWARDGRKGGIIDEAEAVAVYERASGHPVDRDALRWWSVFSNVKAQGIWLTGTKSFQEGRTDELILPMVSYTLINAEDEALLESLGRAG